MAACTFLSWTICCVPLPIADFNLCPFAGINHNSESNSFAEFCEFFLADHWTWGWSWRIPLNATPTMYFPHNKLLKYKVDYILSLPLIFNSSLFFSQWKPEPTGSPPPDFLSNLNTYFPITHWAPTSWALCWFPWTLQPQDFVYTCIWSFLFLKAFYANTYVTHSLTSFRPLINQLDLTERSSLTTAYKITFYPPWFPISLFYFYSTFYHLTNFTFI